VLTSNFLVEVVVDRITRKELKTDKFALEVGHTVEYFEQHRSTIIKYGSIVVVVVVAVVAYYFYARNQRVQRQSELHTAIQIQDAQISPAPVDNSFRTYTTVEERTKAARKAFQDIATQHAGTEEGLAGKYYLGTIAADEGKLTEAEKWLREVADSGNADYASLGKLALAPIYAAEGRAGDAERLLRSVMDKPTLFVSKEQATITLARLIAKSRPAEARKLLEPLRTERSAVSRAAITALAEISGR
jgi:predicted negative regulator of RcsB-dependent stress response